MLDELDKLPPEMSKPDNLLAYNGYFSQGNVKASEDRGITPLIALDRDHIIHPWKNASLPIP